MNPGVLVCAVVAVFVFQQADSGDALRAMVETERAFARMSVEVNQRDAFLAFFAAEGVNFSPEPVNTRETLAKRAAPARPRARVLDWEPAVVSVAASGDLGYSTGPFAVTDVESGGKRLSEGWFFSVWRRQPDGTWRVMADLGVVTSGVGGLRPRKLEVLRPTEDVRKPGSSLTGVRGAGRPGAVLEQEREFSGRAAREGVGRAFMAWSTDQTRVYRPGLHPIVGKNAIAAALSSSPPTRWYPAGSGISSAGDLAYVYGTYEAPASGPAGGERGGYLRVWRYLDGRWLLAADLVAHRPAADAG